MNHQEPPDFGALLRHYRLAAGLTQEGLAERAHLSTRAISDLERGVKRAPRRDTIDLLIAALGLSRREQDVFRARARGCPPRVGEIPAAPASPAEVRALREVPLVGRAHELSLMERHIRQHGPPCLLLAGEPGIGKSRLLREIAHLASKRGCTVFAGGCDSRQGQGPFAPVLETLEHFIRAQQVVTLRSLLAGCAWLVRVLPELADGPIDPVPSRDVDPAQERRLVFRAIQRFLRNAAGPAGVVMLLDDLQWAEDDALDLIADLARNADEIPLRIIAAYRDTELAASRPLADLLGVLSQSGLVTHHHLAPLANADARTLLIAALPGPDGRQSPLQDDILRRAEGVPFYLVSLAELARDPVACGALPWSVEQSVNQRVQALPAPGPSVLAAAAVLGREVDASLLQAVTGLSADALLEIMDAADSAYLLVETDDHTFRFTHDLIREVLEADLSAARRMRLHQLAGEAIERAWQDGATGGPLPVERLAYHFRQSGDRERAITYVSRCADRANAMAAHHDEIALLGEAIVLAERRGRHELVAGFRARRGLAHFDLGQWSAARDDLECAVTSFAGEPGEQLARMLVTLAMVCHWVFDVASTRRYATWALQVAERLDHREIAAEAMSALAFAESSDGELTASLHLYQRAFAIGGAKAAPRLAPAGEMSSLISYWRGEYEQAIASGQVALRLAREASDTTSTARVLGNLGLAFTGSGRYGEALMVFAEARRYCREHGLLQWLARATSMEGSLHLALRDFAAAEALAEEACEIARSVSWPLGEVSAEIDLLLNRARRGDVGMRTDRLLQSATDAADAARGAHGWLWRLRLSQARAELALARDAWQEADQLAEEAILLAKKHGRVKYEALGRTTRATARRRLHHEENARADLAAALALARSTRDPALLLHVSLEHREFLPDEALGAELQIAAARIITSLPDDALRTRFTAALTGREC